MMDTLDTQCDIESRISNALWEKNLIVQFVSLLLVNISNHFKTVGLLCLKSHNFVIFQDN